MNTFAYILNFCLILLYTTQAHTPANVIEYTYYVDEGSKLFIEGTSNINSFECACKSNFPKSVVRFQNTEDAKGIRFIGTTFKIKSQSLDCDNSRMNSDLQEALKAEEFPEIKIDFKDANFPAGGLNNADAWVAIKVNATMTITNVTRDVVLSVRAKKIASNKFRFTCVEEIKLTDYNIEPPTAMLGLIKVRNNIKINFDLITVAEEK